MNGMEQEGPTMPQTPTGRFGDNQGQEPGSVYVACGGK